jgi:hypothetical protein
MLLRHLAALIIASTASALFSMDAAANSRFKVQNDSGKKVKIEVFKGNDTECVSEAKTKKVPKGKTKSMGCEGKGMGLCKIKVYAEGKEICKSKKKHCSGTAVSDKAITVDDGWTVEITDKFHCKLNP